MCGVVRLWRGRFRRGVAHVIHRGAGDGPGLVGHGFPGVAMAAIGEKGWDGADESGVSFAPADLGRVGDGGMKGLHRRIRR